MPDGGRRGHTLRGKPPLTFRVQVAPLGRAETGAEVVAALSGKKSRPESGRRKVLAIPRAVPEPRGLHYAA